MPRVHAQMEKRTYFCNYLLQTGIFGHWGLDIQHQDVSDRVLRELIQAGQEREERYWYGNPKAQTEYSEKLLSVDFNAFSQAAHKDGHALHFQKMDHFSADHDYVVSGENGQVAFEAFGKALVF